MDDNLTFSLSLYDVYVAVYVGATLPRVIPGPAPPAAHSNVSYEEEETLSFKPVGVNTLESGSGESAALTLFISLTPP